MILQQLVNGLTLGSLYALIALGYTMVYGVLLMINFAHSEIFMSGAFVSLFAYEKLSKYMPPVESFLLALLAAFIVSALLAALTVPAMPGLFSTMTVCPQSVPSFSANARARMSLTLPAVNGLMIVPVLVG